MAIRKPLFSVGALIFSQGVDCLMREGKLDPMPYFQLHAQGYWGYVEDDVRQANSVALTDGGQIESLFPFTQDINVRVYTLADRSATYIELASEV